MTSLSLSFSVLTAGVQILHSDKSVVSSTVSYIHINYCRSGTDRDLEKYLTLKLKAIIQFESKILDTSRLPRYIHRYCVDSGAAKYHCSIAIGC